MKLFTSTLALFGLAMTAAQPVVDNILVEARHAPIGQFISHCSVPGTVALTFDDGPSIHTPGLIQMLSKRGVVATFFVNGYTAAWTPDWHAIVRRAYNDGHQIASHTFSHRDLSTLSWADMEWEMLENERQIAAAVGVIPTYMRPPYLNCNDACLTLMRNLGYSVISTDLDSKDYENQRNIWNSAGLFDGDLNYGGNLALAHDIYGQTVQVLTPHMLDIVLRRGLKPVTVAQCLGDYKDWYRSPR
ncbi:uncharacterized protein L3040_004692 [Drepanopeziza brunnea f. sp. 'multigermtubi']|uniref:Chitin deacetylase n=1 Tax=Marssonina brunnea f. sp. multigermtubi (strain MB_m1) TaxID=1072389 RepID=K1WT11_MARBU|nr:chitin deacetylase [Drepanopeziza brunnea f. sp. 'multigermtubi' MB_m1]EKD20785.1 chitin deacetylase [Drepanopeziza brunnea f. sp. 'multigermtubi' MB_m1]KAJ5042135.1 hypothetical protein L3040_004692 [Drepanopeziza brunnea f. sp. 'multigermtubi']